MYHNVMNTIHRSLTGKGLIGSLLFYKGRKSKKIRPRPALIKF